MNIGQFLYSAQNDKQNAAEFSDSRTITGSDPGFSMPYLSKYLKNRGLTPIFPIEKQGNMIEIILLGI
jgi:hypothetical protein